jgi:urease beta subunit
VLYLHVGEPQDAEGKETPEGHVLRFEPGTQRVVGLTVLGAQAILDRDGELHITIPKSVKVSADDLAPALAAV